VAAHLQTAHLQTADQPAHLASVRQPRGPVPPRSDVGVKQEAIKDWPLLSVLCRCCAASGRQTVPAWIASTHHSVSSSTLSASFSSSTATTTELCSSTRASPTSETCWDEPTSSSHVGCISMPTADVCTSGFSTAEWLPSALSASPHRGRDVS